MRKHLLFTAVATMAMSLTGTLSSMAQGYQTTIPFVETFDDETHYTLGGDCRTDGSDAPETRTRKAL